MSRADELLETYSDEGISTLIADNSTEEHIIIDADRNVIVPESLRRIAVQFDNNIETVTFDCPRYWDEHDMSKMAVFINYLPNGGEADQDIAKNVRVDENNPSIMHFEWTVSQNATMKEGRLIFLVDVKATNGEHWHSELCQDMYVSKGLEPPPIIEFSNPDVLTRILLFHSDVIDLNRTTLERASVYVGSGDMPEWANVQIDPDGDAPVIGGVGSGSSVELDTTLTQSGKAADAKAVGDALSEKLDSSELTEAIETALSEAKASGEFDGYSPTVSVSKIGKVTTIAITDKDGTKVATINDGADGDGSSTGSGGEDGIGIASIIQTTKSTEDDGINILTIMLTDGSVHTFEVQNGSRGSDYVLTSDDKTEIAQEAAGMVDVELDTTLTQSGKAADAKAVGDALSEKLDSSELTEAIETALSEAKASGEFNYVLTSDDKTEIAQQAAEMVDVPTELPTVTASDNGYFLRVVNGEWAKTKIDSAEGGSF